jgi:hypothetical protein
MIPEHITVFLPCHTLDDFPTWLDEAEADALLAAWTAAWDPRLIAAVGRMPAWASVDLPPPVPQSCLGIVPSFADERFAAQIAGLASEGSAWVRGLAGRHDIIAAAVTAVGAAPAGPSLAPDFHALGLAWLIGELLARRMRSHSDVESSGFAAGVVAAARAAVAGDEALARERLGECFGALEAARSHYYPVDFWLVDLLLLADSTLGASLDAELESPVPLAVVATGEVIDALAWRNPAALARMRDRREAGLLAGVGGRHDARPLDLCVTPEIEESFSRGMRAWTEHLGAAPRIFGQFTGGWSPILPRLLADRGYRGAIWTLFDGTSLPDPGASRIVWQGMDGGSIDGLARAPLDARVSRTILQLADRIGDAMDHDHAAIMMFAHFPGTAAPWFGDLRRIGAWCRLLGGFATPEEVLDRTAEAGVVVNFKADAYPVSLPRSTSGIRGQVAEEQEFMRRAAAALPPSSPGATAGPATAAPPPVRRAGFVRRLFGGDDLRFVLDNGLVRVKVQEATGGILAVHGPGDRGNRISQRLAVRSTRPAAPAGQPGQSVEERADYAAMVADAIDRVGDAIESHGRLVDAGGAAVATFEQVVRLLPARPLVVVEMRVQTTEPLAPTALESYVACRIAWHENEMPDIHRSLHLEPIVTERWMFTAPHFIQIRTAGRHEQPPTTIFTLGLPWHVRTSEHMLDTILPADDRPSAGSRIVIGVGAEAAAAVAIDLLRAGADPVDRTIGQRIRSTP